MDALRKKRDEMEEVQSLVAWRKVPGIGGRR